MLKHSNHSRINDTEMQIIYVVKNKLQVNWAYIIMHHMVHQKKLFDGLPYARLITKVLEFYQIDLHGKSRFKMNAKEHEINIGTTNKNMGIFKDKDCIFKHRDVPSSTSSYSPMPEGGLTNQMLYDKLCNIENIVIQGFYDILSYPKFVPYFLL